MLLSRKQASAKQDRQSNNVVNDQSDDDEIKTDNIAEIPKVERKITFINERIKSSRLLIAQDISPRLFQQLHCHPSVDTRTKRVCSDLPTQL